MRIHTRPWRFIWRVIARRAASICRAVTRSGSIDFRPYEPKLSVKPPLAVPWIRPLNCLRYLVRLGDSISQSSGVLRLAAALAVAARAAIRTVAVAATTLARGAALAGQALVEGHRVVVQDLALE